MRACINVLVIRLTWEEYIVDILVLSRQISPSTGELSGQNQMEIFD